MATNPSRKNAEDDAVGRASEHHFISYARPDSEFVMWLSDKLQKGQPRFRVWIDQKDMEHGSWTKQLEKAIDRCRSVLLVVSRHSNQSKMVEKELHRAEHACKPIIPLLLDSKATVPFLAGNYQYVDFSNSHAEEGLNQLRQLLKKPGSLVSVEPPPATTEPVASNIQPPLVRTGPVVINKAPLVVPACFLGREEQCRRIEEFLADDARVLLWINGRAGSGKTTLACRVLERVQLGVGVDPGQKASVDGIAYIRQEQHARADWFVLFKELPRLVTAEGAAEPQKPAQGCSHRFNIQNFLTSLGDRRIILFLDHLDDLIDIATRNMRGKFLRDALQAVLTVTTHRLKVIVTSRVLPRDLPTGQQSRWFPPLNLAAGLSEKDAKLLVCGFEECQESLLTELYRRTQGNPGAIMTVLESRQKDSSMSLKDILGDEEWFLPDDVLDVLVGKSYASLNDVSKVVMQVLSVAKESLTADAVAYTVHHYLPDIDVGQVLSQLVNLQLVQKANDYYSLHGTDRYYVAAQLDDGTSSTMGGSEDVHLDRNTLYTRHADYIEQMIASKDLPMGSGLRTLQLEQLLYYRFNGKDYAAAFDVLERLEPRLLAEERSGELAAYYEQLVGKLEDPTRSRRLFDALARIYHRLGELDRAAACYEGGLKCVRDKGDLNGQCLYLGNLAICKQESGDLVRTTLYCMAALELLAKTGDRVWEAHTWTIISEALASLGQISGAMQASKRALKLARDNRQLEVEVMGIIEVVALANLGQHYEALGHVDQADDQCNRAYEFAEKIQFQLGKAAARRNLGTLDLNQGKYKQATRHLTDAIQLADKAQSVQLQQTIRIELAAAQLLDSKLGEAEGTVNTAVEFDTPFFTPEAYSLQGIILQRKEKAGEAAESFQHALKQAEVVLKRTPRYYRGLEVMGLSYSGLTLSEKTDEYLDKAIEAYAAAHFITNEPGIIRRRLLLFDALAQIDSEKNLASVRDAITSPAS